MRFNHFTAACTSLACFSLLVSPATAQIYCNDGSCNFGETCQTCPEDCHECGDICCDASAGENQCTCPGDCGAPPANEIPGSTCNDGIDNDCDFVTDCDDLDCETDTACAPFCDDGNCDPDEDQCTCPGDCGAPPANEIPGSTCDDGINNDCDFLTDCNDPDCETDTACVPFCGDGNCDPDEDQCTCSADCGAPPAGEVPGQTCGDGRDNDCDSLTDCDDPDCESDTACAPPPPPDGGIPSVSQWGIAVMGLLLLISGKVYFKRRRPDTA